MAEESLISSLYPPPPAYYKFFTQENLDKARKYEQDGVELKDDEKHMEFLKPPQQPEGETYRSFGSVWQFNDKIPQLEDMGIPQLYKTSALPSGEDSQIKILALKKLLKSLLLNFLEVVGVMSVAPQEFSTKVEHIRTILINIHHLLNEYRPHQSRESVILLLENQVETKRREIKEIEQVCEEVEEKVRSLVAVFVDGKVENVVTEEEQEPQHEQEQEQKPEDEQEDVIIDEQKDQ